MAITKASHFKQDHIRTAELAKALAHPARIAILYLLSERASCICGDITEELPLAQSTVSQHLKALKHAGIIKGTIDGVRTCYCLNPEVVDELTVLLQTLVHDLSKPGSIECC